MIKRLKKSKSTSVRSTEAAHPRKSEGLWYNRHNRLWLVVAVLIFAVAGYFLLFSHAAPPAPNVYLVPSGSVFPASTTFTVQIRENSGTTGVNAIEADISYPSTLLSFVSASNTGSAFTTVAESTAGTGTYEFDGGTPQATTGTSVTGDQLVETLTFKTLTTGGAAALAFTTGTVLDNAATNTDLLGGLANTTGTTVNVDTTPPTVTLTAPANNATLAFGNTVSVTATSTDTQSSIASVSFYVDGTLASTVTTSPYTYSWNTAASTIGSHTLQAKSTDSSGNVGSSTIFTVNLTDQTPPTAPTVLHATASTYTSITLAWTASTDNVGVTSYRLSRNGTVVATISSPTVTYTDTGLTKATSYNYSLVALDAAGNVSTAATLTSSSAAQVPGDCDGDGHVGSSDLVDLLANWHSTTNLSCEFDGSGIIDITDLSILLSHYGT